MTHPTTINAPAGLPFVDVVREFDAPVAAVFRAHVDPDLFARWTGPRGMRMDAVELNPVTGGRWSFAFRGGSDNQQFSFFGVFHAVEPNRLIVQTSEFNMASGQVGLSATHFDELSSDGRPRTRLTMHEIYHTLEARDAALASGMEHGITEGYEKLDDLLAS